MTQRFAAVFVVIGSSCVVLGGLVAAVTGPLGLDDGSWLAAYLVLVCGVAQCAIGTAQQRLAVPPVTPRRWWIQLSCWNVGNAAVILGTLIRIPLIVDLGGAVLLVTLALALHAVRRSPGRPVSWAYRGVLIVLIASIGVGLVLAQLRVR